MSAPAQPPARYRIRIRGHLDPAWSAWFDSLTVTQADDGTTELVGPLVDQAALFGLLARLRDLGATLLLAEQLTAEPRQPDTWRDARELLTVLHRLRLIVLSRRHRGQAGVGRWSGAGGPRSRHRGFGR